MSLRNHIRLLRLLAAAALLWSLIQAGESLVRGDLLSALAVAMSGLIWLALVVLLPLKKSEILSCSACGRSFGPAILLRSRCPHCGAGVSGEARSPRRIAVAFLLILALTAGAAAYTWPMSFPTLPGEAVSVTVVRELDPLIMEDIFVGIPQSETERYTLTPGSSQAEEIADILSDYTYRRCFKTLRGDHFISGTGEASCYFYAPGFDVNLLGCRYVWVNDAVYQVGWAGDQAGAELTARVAAVLEDQTL